MSDKQRFILVIITAGVMLLGIPCGCLIGGLKGVIIYAIIGVLFMIGAAIWVHSIPQDGVGNNRTHKTSIASDCPEMNDLAAYLKGILKKV
jgi:hypothetical protein